jgi:hypothetical protein
MRKAVRMPLTEAYVGKDEDRDNHPLGEESSREVSTAAAEEPAESAEPAAVAADPPGEATRPAAAAVLRKGEGARMLMEAMTAVWTMWRRKTTWFLKRRWKMS